MEFVVRELKIVLRGTLEELDEAAGIIGALKCATIEETLEDEIVTEESEGEL